MKEGQMSKEEAKKIYVLLRGLERKQMEISNYLRDVIDPAVGRLLIKRLARNNHDTYSFFQSIIETDIGKIDSDSAYKDSGRSAELGGHPQSPT